MPMVQLSDDTQYRSYQDVKVGDRVTVSKYEGAGVVRFVGVIDTQRTHGKSRVGVELDSACGKHNGTVDGHAYFKCAEKHGLLVPRERVILLTHANPPQEFGFGPAEPINDEWTGDGHLEGTSGDSAGSNPGFGFGTVVDAKHAAKLWREHTTHDV